MNTVKPVLAHEARMRELRSQRGTVFAGAKRGIFRSKFRSLRDELGQVFFANHIQLTLQQRSGLMRSRQRTGKKFDFKFVL